MSTTKMGLTIEEAAECTGIGRKTIIRTDTLEHFMTVNQGRNLLNEKDVRKVE